MLRAWFQARGFAAQYKALPLICALLLPAPSQAESDPFNPSNLPIPRFVSLKSDKVNVRIGPGKNYQIRWVYKRRHLPVEVVEEFGAWRKIRDKENDAGWVHKSLLEGRRMALVKDGDHTMFRLPDQASAPMLIAKEGVMAPLVECTGDWCRLEIAERKGWMEKQHLWGVYPDELIEQ